MTRNHGSSFSHRHDYATQYTSQPAGASDLELASKSQGSIWPLFSATGRGPSTEQTTPRTHHDPLLTPFAVKRVDLSMQKYILSSTFS
jgi:hypothetical protein